MGPLNPEFSVYGGKTSGLSGAQEAVPCNTFYSTPADTCSQRILLYQITRILLLCGAQLLWNLHSVSMRNATEVPRWGGTTDVYMVLRLGVLKHLKFRYCIYICYGCISHKILLLLHFFSDSIRETLLWRSFKRYVETFNKCSVNSCCGSCTHHTYT